MQFRILGPFEVERDGLAVELGGRQQRALLAILLLHRGEPISTDRLIDSLWGERPPPSAVKTVQVYISTLRKALGDRVIETRGAGYVLSVAGDEVDAERFGVLVAEGRRALDDSDPVSAAQQLRSALALWRGEPLAEFAYDAFAQTEIRRLRDARLTALEDRIDADLLLGRHPEVTSELEALVTEHPARERLVAQLMLALYRSGRQTAALETYRRSRSALRDHLGLEPGRALRDLERAILAQDPTLDTASAPASSPPGRALSARSLIAAGGGLLLVAAIAASVIALTSASGGSIKVQPNSVAVIDPRVNRVVAQTSVGAAPGSITAGPGGVWVANTEDHTISNIDRASRRVLRTLAFGDDVDAVGADARTLWTVDSTRGRASRIDPAFRSVITSVPVGDRTGEGANPNAIAVGGGVAWVANNSSAVVRIADGGARVSRIDVGNDPSGIALDHGTAWVADDLDGTVSRVDSTGVSAVIPVGPGASGIAVGARSVWVADTLADRLVRIDPTTNSVLTTIPVGSRPRGVAFGDGAVWVANSGDGTVSRVNPRTDRVAATINVGQSPQDLVVTAGSIWVTIAASPPTPAAATGSPAGVVRVVRQPPFSSTDPALAGNTFDPQQLQMLYETCAGLLTYPDLPAPDGTRLVPDLAQGPTVSADGRTWTFAIRHGFRFSPPSDAPVTATTLQHTIERTLDPKLHAYARNYMSDIVGMPAYEAGRTAHLAGVTVTGNLLRIRLRAPSPDLPARIATLPFCAVPNDTPATPQTQPIPSAGPYYVSSSSHDQLVLARNPGYGGRRPRVPKEITYAFNVSLSRALNQVATGQSDYVNTAPFGDQTPAALALLQALERRYGPASPAARTGHQRYFVNPTLDLEYFAFNTARHLFASARMRRAVNYAIDRRALVQHHLLFNGGRATDHYLVPGIPGERPVDVYPLGGPDLTKAKHLAGNIHAHATMYTCSIAPQCLQDARIVQTDLAAIGITVEITALPDAALYSRLAKPGEPWDITWSNWLADFPDPFTMINEIYDPASPFNFGRYNNPALTTRMRQAAKLSDDRRLQAYFQLDAKMTRTDPPAVPWGIGTFREFFSTRIGCQTYQPIYGFDLGSLCIRP